MKFPKLHLSHNAVNEARFLQGIANEPSTKIIHQHKYQLRAAALTCIQNNNSENDDDEEDKFETEEDEEDNKDRAPHIHKVGSRCGNGYIGSNSRDGDPGQHQSANPHHQQDGGGSGVSASTV